MTKSTITQEFDAIKTMLEALEPLSEPQREFALNMVTSRLGISYQPKSQQSSQVPGSGSPASGQSMPIVNSGNVHVRDFLKQKKPETDLERLVSLAYFLTKHQNTETFTTRDITAINAEAGGQNFSNARATAANATRQSKMLGNAPQGKKRLTLRGEELVEALPDREKVKEVLKNRPAKRKSRSRASKKK